MGLVNAQRTNRIKAKPPVPRPENQGDENDPSARVTVQTWLNLADSTLRVHPIPPQCELW